MYNLMGYLFILALILFLGTFFAISMQLDYKRIKKKAEREMKKLDILCDLITLDQTIQLNNVPQNAYLSQIGRLIKNDPFDIDKIKIVVCRSRKGNDSDQKIYRAYKKAPASVKSAMVELSEILERIYDLNHPLKHKMLELKKNIQLRFLLLVLKICCFLIDYLEKRDEKKNRTKIKNIKKHQNKVRKCPDQILLNGFELNSLAEAC